MNDNLAGEQKKSAKTIRSKKDFEDIYRVGKLVYSVDKRFKAHFIISEKTHEKGVSFAAVVSKKFGNGVWRNRQKRLIRESFRKTKHILNDSLKKKNLLLKIVISPNLVKQDSNNKITLDQTLPCVADILSNIHKQLL